MLDPRSQMVSFPWGSQGCPLQTLISSRFSWPKSRYYIPLSRGVKFKFLTKDHKTLTRPLTSEPLWAPATLASRLSLQHKHALALGLWLAVPCAWMLCHEMAMWVLLHLIQLSAQILKTFSTICCHHSPSLPPVSFFSRAPGITWNYIIFLLLIFGHHESRSFVYLVFYPQCWRYSKSSMILTGWIKEEINKLINACRQPMDVKNLDNETKQWLQQQETKLTLWSPLRKGFGTPPSCAGLHLTRPEEPALFLWHHLPVLVTGLAKKSCRLSEPLCFILVLYWSHLQPNCKGLRIPWAQMPALRHLTRGAKGERPSHLWLLATTEGAVCLLLCFLEMEGKFFKFPKLDYGWGMEEKWLPS